MIFFNFMFRLGYILQFELTKNILNGNDIINRPAYKKAMDINYSR